MTGEGVDGPFWASKTITGGKSQLGKVDYMFAPVPSIYFNM